MDIAAAAAPFAFAQPAPASGALVDLVPAQSPAATSRSVPDRSRRLSLPLHFLPPSLWSANTSSVSLAGSEEAARGEHTVDEASVAHRISALRQLNGATRSQHRYAKSTGARNSTFSQPVIVRTYSGARPRSQQRDLITVKKENGYSPMTSAKMDLQFPPVEAWRFKDIMEEIQHGVAEDLERIAEICARSKYSLSNQYEVHMPPHGRGDLGLQTTAVPVAGSYTNEPPTLQAIGSDDEQTRVVGRGPPRVTRKTKSIAYGTLETIMSSSRSSDEDKSRKLPAAVLAEEVRGKALSQDAASEPFDDPTPPLLQNHGRLRHGRSKSVTLASVFIDNAQNSPRHDAAVESMSPAALISEPARPQTSTGVDLGGLPTFGRLQRSLTSAPPDRPLIRNEPMSPTLRMRLQRRPSLLGNLGSWLPWNKTNSPAMTLSHAEGSLRELLKIAPTAVPSDKKGKGIDYGGEDGDGGPSF